MLKTTSAGSPVNKSSCGEEEEEEEEEQEEQEEQEEEQEEWMLMVKIE